MPRRCPAHPFGRWLRSAARLGCGLLLVAGLWQCARDTTSSGPARLSLDLRRTGAPGTEAPEITRIEIEVAGPSGIAARDTILPAEDGTFRTSLPLPSGGPYEVRVFGWGSAVGLLPAATDSGVVAAGSQGGIEIVPLRTATARLTVTDAVTRGLAVTGWFGEATLAASWSPVPEASAYTLAWYIAQTAEAGSSAIIADTATALTWDEVTFAARSGGAADSVLFRVRPRFGQRPGVFGESLWVDLAFWLDPPRLDSLAPGAGATVGADTATVYLCFDRQIDATSIPAGVHWTRQPAGTAVPFSVDPQTSPSASFRLQPAEALAMGSDYRVTIAPQVVDLIGRPFDGDTLEPGLQLVSVDWSTASYDPLRVAEMSPADGDTALARDLRVIVALTRAADVSSLTAEAVYVTGAGDERIAGLLSASAGGDSLYWSPAELLWYATDHTLQITPELRDPRGMPFDQQPETYPELEPFAASFRTLSQPPGPRVLAIDPDSGATSVWRSAQIQVTFSEPIDPATVRHYDTFRVLRNGEVGISGTITHDAAGEAFHFQPSSPLAGGTNYLVRLRATLPGGAIGITNLAGEPLDQDRSAVGFQDFVAWFRTERPPQVQQVTFAPSDGDTLVDVEPMITLAFTCAIDAGSVDAARLQVRRGGAPIAVSVSAVADSLAQIRPASPLAYLTRYSVWADTLIAAPDGSLLDQDLAADGRQPFELFFKTEPESLHPQVDTVFPECGDTTAVVSDSVWLAFSVPIDPLTASGSLTLTRLSGAGAPEFVSGFVAADSLTAHFFPDGELAYATEYRVDLSTALLSATGFALDQEPETPGLQAFTSSFRTQRESIPPVVTGHDPLPGASEVPVDSPITIIFSEPMQPASVASAFHLLRGETDVPGEGSLDASNTEWVFVPQVALEYLTNYGVFVDTLAVDSVGNHLDQHPATPEADPCEFGFQTAPDYDSPRVVATEPGRGQEGVGVDLGVRITFSEAIDPASVPGGALRIEDPVAAAVPGRVTFEPGDSVLVWAPLSLPDSLATWLEFGTTYTVIADTLLTDRWGNRLDQDPGAAGLQADSFFFATLPETLAPRVTALLPGTADVPVSAQPRLVFSEAMDVSSLQAADVIRLEEVEGPLAPFSIETAATGDTVRLVLESWLEFDRDYRIAVATGACDLAGNPLDQQPDLPGDQPYEQIFHTEVDLEPPRVVAVFPDSGAAHVDPATLVRITFSEPIDPSTLHEGSAYLVGPAGIVALATSPWLEEGHRVAVLQPADSLVMGAVFTVIATHLLCDLAGNALDQDPGGGGNQDFTATFTTGWGPVIVWDGPVCDWGDSARVLLDATASYEHDPGDSIAWAVWDWGDGQIDSLEDAARLIGYHDYGSLDLRGCNGIDDDGDGWVDEADGEGLSPCDESYRIHLRVYDTHGLMDQAVAGVSFCAFLARASEPSPGEYVAPWDSLWVSLSRPVDAGSIDSSVVLLQLPDSTDVAIDLTLGDSARVVVVKPQLPLRGGTHLLRLTPGLRDSYGIAFDQDPATVGRQPFDLRFHVPIKPDDPPPSEWFPDSLPPSGD